MKIKPKLEVTINDKEINIHEDNGRSLFTVFLDTGEVHLITNNEVWQNIKKLEKIETVKQEGLKVEYEVYKIITK